MIFLRSFKQKLHLFKDNRTDFLSKVFYLIRETDKVFNVDYLRQVTRCMRHAFNLTFPAKGSRDDIAILLCNAIAFKLD